MKPLRYELMEAKRPRALGLIMSLSALLPSTALMLSGAIAWRVESVAVRAELATLMQDQFAAGTMAAVASPQAVSAALGEESAQLIRESVFPWSELLQSLDQTSQAGVRVQSIDLDASVWRASVEVNASTSQQLNSYVEALNAGFAESPWRVMDVRRQANGTSLAVVRWKSS